MVSLSKADRALARLDGAASVLPAVDHFISMYVFQEAALSSQIEGTQATLIDALEADANEMASGESRNDVQEILNYVAAMRFGMERIAELPVSQRLIEEIHKTLMTDARGGDPVRTPGEIRRTQNWWGGSSPANARYVPPPIHEMKLALGEWESAVHDPEWMLPPLLRIGILHAQFETIHPFLDGNGRVGRLIVTFLLLEESILAEPLLYLSIFLKKNRDEYNSRLQAVRDEGDWEGWLAFFIEGVHAVATAATQSVRDILALRERDRDSISELGARSGKALLLHESLFMNPVVDSKRVQRLLGVSQPTADALLDAMEGLGVLREWTQRRRGRSWIYDEYVQLFTREIAQGG
ncbi:MAG: Fic family protein [Acidimicrobiia bacterium]|nr:Fic family protein [Acidimicrobiia bacterium]